MVKYEELLASFNQLQLQKKSIQEHMQNESSEATILVAQLKESEAKEMKMKKEMEKLQEENHQLQEDLKSLNCGDLQAELSKKISNLKIKLESENLQQSNEEECKRLLDDLGTKSTSEAELQKKVTKLHLTATKAINSKEDAEIKCQNKIADMVALMEKHKELELSQQNIENGRLKEQLEKEMKERESLLQEVKDLKKEMTSQKTRRQLETQDKQVDNQVSEHQNTSFCLSQSPKKLLFRQDAFVPFGKGESQIYENSESL
ncbi:unnamed protein product [Coregonus sp. 'balchen']|nr:unnamed protein product [Coregonus sp. 'balchen']